MEARNFYTSQQPPPPLTLFLLPYPLYKPSNLLFPRTTSRPLQHINRKQKQLSSKHEASHHLPVPLLVSTALFDSPELCQRDLLQQQALLLLQLPPLPWCLPPLELPLFQWNGGRRVPRAGVLLRLGRVGRQSHRQRHDRSQRLPRLPGLERRRHGVHHQVLRLHRGGERREGREPELPGVQQAGGVRERVLHHLRHAGATQQQHEAEHSVAGVDAIAERRAQRPPGRRQLVV